MCFPRDTLKDRIIVWSFILGTTGLLGWAGLRRVLEARERRSTGAAVPSGQGAQGSEGGMFSRAGGGGGGLWARLAGGGGGQQGGGGGGHAGGGGYAPLESPGR